MYVIHYNNNNMLFIFIQVILMVLVLKYIINDKERYLKILIIYFISFVSFVFIAKLFLNNSNNLKDILNIVFFEESFKILISIFLLKILWNNKFNLIIILILSWFLFWSFENILFLNDSNSYNLMDQFKIFISRNTSSLIMHITSMIIFSIFINKYLINKNYLYILIWFISSILFHIFYNYITWSIDINISYILITFMIINYFLLKKINLNKGILY